MNTWLREELIHLRGVTVTHSAIDILHTTVCTHACSNADLGMIMYTYTLTCAACLYDGLVGCGTCSFSFLLRCFHVVF